MLGEISATKSELPSKRSLKETAGRLTYQPTFMVPSLFGIADKTKEMHKICLIYIIIKIFKFY